MAYALVEFYDHGVAVVNTIDANAAGSVISDGDDCIVPWGVGKKRKMHAAKVLRHGGTLNVHNVFHDIYYNNAT